MDWHQLWEVVSAPDNIPIVALIFLVPFYAWLGLRQGLANDRLIKQLEADPQLAKTHHRKTQPWKPGWVKEVHAWPYLLRMEFLASIIVTVILIVWSITLNAPLEELSNPNLTMNPAKAPWYFLGLQAMLMYFDPWIAGVVMPSLIIVGLMAIPHIDIKQKGNGYYTFKERKFSIITFCVGFIILWVSLINLGTFWRGPGWYLFFPWEEWDTHRVVALTNVDLSEVFGIHTRKADYSLNPAAVAFGAAVILGYYSLIGAYWLKKRNSDLIKKLGFLRYNIVAFLFLTMTALPIKMILRIGFNIKYILVTPWFNI